MPEFYTCLELPFIQSHTISCANLFSNIMSILQPPFEGHEIQSLIFESRENSLDLTRLQDHLIDLWATVTPFPITL